MPIVGQIAQSTANLPPRCQSLALCRFGAGVHLGVGVWQMVRLATRRKAQNASQAQSSVVRMNVEPSQRARTHVE
eukprot:4975075-Amphidinium_carterae.1